MTSQLNLAKLTKYSWKSDTDKVGIDMSLPHTADPQQMLLSPHWCTWRYKTQADYDIWNNPLLATRKEKEWQTHMCNGDYSHGSTTYFLFVWMPQQDPQL